MDKRVKGAWVVHHAAKLQTVTSGMTEFEQIHFAGKCGALLSALSGTEEAVVSSDKLNAIARASNVSPRLELPQIIEELKRQKLVVGGEAGFDMARKANHAQTTSRVLPANC